MEWNYSVYFRLSKILCGFKDQVRARSSGEKCGLDTKPRLELSNRGFLLFDVLRKRLPTLLTISPFQYRPDARFC
jgi:hypothetical protein